MLIYHISSVYNTPEFVESDGVNRWLDIDVFQTREYGPIHLNCTSTEMWIEDDGIKHTSEPYNYNLIINNDDAIWQLIFEDIENSYRAFHAYAVAHDGSHLNYMDIKLTKTTEV